MPEHPRFRFQAVHSLDVGDAFRRALLTDVSGAFNLAADPVLDGETLSKLLHAKRIRVSPGLLRKLASLSWHLRLQRTEPGWIDLCFGVPIMSTERARRLLGWEPRHTSLQALAELLDGMRSGEHFQAPPLAARPSGAG